MNMENHSSTHKLGSAFKTLFTLIVALYIAAVACYLILRALLGDRFWPLALVNTFAYFLFLPLLFLLPLALLLRARRNALRLVPLLLIGGLWFAPYYVPKTPAATEGHLLRVLTFNVWGGNQRMGEAMDWVNASGADVVLLQEVVPFYAQKLLPNLYERYPYHFSQEDLLRWDGSPNANVTLSRYPILDMQVVDLHTPETADPLRIVLDVNGQQVAVYNVHLAWPAREPRWPIPRVLYSLPLQVALGYDDRARNNQIAHLLDHLKHEPLPYIVAGDFNTSDQSPTYQALATHMNDAFRAAGRGFGGSWPVSSARGLPAFLPPLIRIDYIWHSDHLRAVEAGQGPPLGSDHLALLATLALSTAD